MSPTLDNPELVLLSAERECLRRGQLEQVLKYPFSTKASPLQTAILRAADGRPIGDCLTEEETIKFFGCEKSKLGLSVPLLVVIVAGVRSGKSLLVSVASVCRAMTADMSQLKKHTIPRVRIVCPKAENALETFRHILGAVEGSSGLRSCLFGEPKFSPHPSLTLLRLDGRRVQISVGAADSGGLSMRSGWLAGYVLDEAALFGESAAGAAVNAEEIIQAAETRLLPGGQGWVVSSPYGPTGLLYDLYTRHWGKPGRVLVCRASTLAMNPGFSRDLVEAVRLEKPDVAAREYDAEWVDADSAFFEGVLVDKAVRQELDVPPKEGSRYLAAMDAGTRGNAWTLVILRDTRERGDRIAKLEVSFAYEWVGSRSMPLDPADIFKQMKTKLDPYGIMTVNCDAYALDPLRSVAKSTGLRLNEHTFRGEQKTEVFRAVDALLRQGRLELPPVAAVTRDLKAVRRRATAGQILPHLPQTADGRHCDYASSISLGVWLLAGYSFSTELQHAMESLAEHGGPEEFFSLDTTSTIRM
jgi:hypothetical protein